MGIIKNTSTLTHQQMYPGQDPRLGGYTNRHTGAVIHAAAPGSIARGPIAHAPLDGRVGAPLAGAQFAGAYTSGPFAGAPLAGAYVSGPQHQQISPNAPGHHNEYPVTTIEHEPVTRIETVPVTKQIQVPVTHMESKEVSETI